jgi:hypothetical protein
LAGNSDSTLSACKTVLACKPVRALQGGIQSDGVSPVIQLFCVFEETSRDWPRRATSFFASPKKEAKKATAGTLPFGFPGKWRTEREAK